MPVTEILAPKIPVSIQLGSMALIVALVVGMFRPGWNMLNLFKLTPLVLVALGAELLLASAAVAAYHWRLFDAVWFFNTPPASEGVARQSHLFKGTVNGVEVTVNEAVYDGRTLYLMWTYRLPDVDVPLGVAEDGTLSLGISEEIWQLLQAYDMRLWTERIWFDGREADMTTAGSGGMTTGTAEPGVIEEYYYLRLDKDDVFLDGKVEVNCAFETLVRLQRTEMAAQVAAALFD